MSTKDLTDEMKLELCYVYRMDVLMMKQLGYRTQCDDLFATTTTTTANNNDDDNDMVITELQNYIASVESNIRQQQQQSPKMTMMMTTMTTTNITLSNYSISKIEDHIEKQLQFYIEMRNRQIEINKRNKMKKNKIK